MGNKWFFNNKNVFATDTVVWVTTGAEQKSQNGQFKGFQFVSFEALKKSPYKTSAYQINF